MPSTNTKQIQLVVRARDMMSPVLGKMGGGLKLFGAIAGIAGGVALGQKFVQGVSDAIKVTAEFEKQLSGVAAVSRATGKDMGRLRQQAEDLGSTTIFTAGQSAEAQAMLARAGFEVNEIMSALPGTLDLAAAGELGLAEASSITANILRAFGKDASQATDIADLLAKTANSANTNVQELGQAFVYAAPAAKTLGVTADETSAALAILANNGITASMAGTAMRKTFTTMMGQLEEGQEGLGRVASQLFDAEGKFVGLAEAIRLMEAAGIDSSQAFEIFGERAGNAMAILLDAGPDALDATTEALRDRLGFAADVAAVKLNNLSGDVVKMRSASEGLKIAIGSGVTPKLRELVQTFTVIIQAITEWEKRTGTLGTILGAFVDFATWGLSMLVEVVHFLARAWKGAETLVAQFGEVLMGVMQLATGAVRDLLDALNIGGVFDSWIEKVYEAEQGFAAMGAGFTAQAAQVQREAEAMDEGFENLKEAIDGVPAAIAEMNAKQEALAALTEEQRRLLEGQAEATDTLRRSMGEYTSSIEDYLGPAEQALILEQARADRHQQQLDAVTALMELGLEFDEAFPDGPPYVPSDEEIARMGKELDALLKGTEAERKRQKVLVAGEKIAKNFAANFAQNTAALVANAKSAEDAMRAMAAGIIEALGQEAIAQAAMEIAKAFAALAAFNYGGAGLHFAAAAKWTLGATVAFAAAGAVKAQQGFVAHGTDRTPVLMSRDEGILDAPATRAVLGGNAAIVPVGATEEDEGDAAGLAGLAEDLRGTILSGDAFAELLERNPRAFGAGYRAAVQRGEIG